MSYLSEGWVKYYRYNCVEGFIDIWKGDSYSNPNDIEKQQLSLNSIDTYFRLNGGEWIRRDKIFRRSTPEPLLGELSKWNTAVEIWETYKDI